MGNSSSAEQFELAQVAEAEKILAGSVKEEQKAMEVDSSSGSDESDDSSSEENREPQSSDNEEIILPDATPICTTNNDEIRARIAELQALCWNEFLLRNGNFKALNKVSAEVCELSSKLCSLSEVTLVKQHNCTEQEGMLEVLEKHSKFMKTAVGSIRPRTMTDRNGCFAGLQL